MARSPLCRALLALAVVTAASGLEPARATQPAAAAANPAAVCPAIGGWMDPGTGDPIAHTDAIARLAERAVVVLGEHHAVAGIQRWQLHTIAALHGRRPDMALAFEAFPRGVQPALDHWVAGELSEDAFLREARWDEVWGLGTEFYMPLFRFARMHRVPMIAMNVDRALIARVGREGWQAVPTEAREGLGDPAPVSAGYRARLAQVLHDKARAGHAAAPEVDEKMLARFVEAQSTWDRAFAQSIADAVAAAPARLVVAIVGRGHAEHGYGIPDQLRDLGVRDVAVALTHADDEPCEDLAADEHGAAIATAVFGIESIPSARPPPPRLGVGIAAIGEGDERAVRVDSVMPDSVAQAAGILPGDQIVSAAGRPTHSVATLVRVIRQQAPGTWLPLGIRRNDQALELVAQFPPAHFPPAQLRPAP